MSTRLLAPVRAWNDRRAVRAARARADEQLLTSRIPSPRLAWRVAELTGCDHRVELARSLIDIVHAVDERRLPGASPIARGAVREARAQLLDVAARLFDPERPVTPRGVLLAERLLDDGRGPLYGRTGARRLRLELERLAAALDRHDG